MTATLTLFAVIVVVFIALVLFLLITVDRQRRRHSARLRRAHGETSAAAPKLKQKSDKKTSQIGLFRRIEHQLAQTSLRVSLNELLVQISVAILGLYAALVLALGMSPLMALPLAVALPLALATLFIRIAKAGYRAAFTDQLPEALDVFARGLRAGRPVSSSLAIVVESTKGPINREFTRCHNEICMGTTLPESLSRLEARVPTAEVSFFAVATTLQAETGGNLIETMESLANQLRERRKLRKKARALSSEARASAMILASLPFAVALAIGVLNGAYLEPLYADPRGRIMAAAAIASITFGVFIMARMGKLDV